MRLARENNPSLRSSMHAVESSRASYFGSWNGFMPQINLTNNYSNSSNPFAAKVAGAAGSAYWQAQAQASLNVFNLSQVATIKTSAASLAQAEASLKQVSTTLRFNLRQAFLQLVFEQESLKVARMVFELRKTQAELVSLRYQSGREYRGNMMLAKAEFLEAQVSANNVQRDLKLAQKALDAQLGLDDFRAVAATGTLSVAAEPAPLGDYEPLLARRPDVQLQMAAVQSAEAALSQSKSSLWPTLSATYSRSKNGVSEFPDAVSNWNVGGLLSYPLFSGGLTSAYFSIGSAKQGLLEARETMRNTRDQAVADMENAWDNFADAYWVEQYHHALLAADRQRNDEADVRYASGLMTYDNWEIIATERIQEESAALNAEFNAVQAQNNWERALGMLLEAL